MPGCTHHELRPLVPIVAREYDDDGEPAAYVLACGHSVNPAPRVDSDFYGDWRRRMPPALRALLGGDDER